MKKELDKFEEGKDLWSKKFSDTHSNLEVEFSKFVSSKKIFCLSSICENIHVVIYYLFHFYCKLIQTLCSYEKFKNALENRGYSKNFILIIIINTSKP